MNVVRYRTRSDSQASLLSLPFDLEPIDESILAEHGEVFTRRWVVELILDLSGYTVDRDLVRLVVIEPSCGSGAFLVPMVERLLESASRHGHSLEEADAAIRAFDLLGRNVGEARAAVVAALRTGGVSARLADRLAGSWVTQPDFLLEASGPEAADFVIGNPPYIGLESVAPARSAAYRQVCETMGGRSDIYVGFYEKGLKALKPDGRLGFICADRWMRNAYGAHLREMVAEGWSVETIIHMTGVDAFEDEVDAYPAITVVRRGEQQGGPLVADAGPEFGSDDAAKLLALALQTGPNEISDAKCSTVSFKAARLPAWFSGKSGWPNGSPERLRLIARLEADFPSLEDTATATKVGIGVATGADRVFIVEEAPRVESERLLPLAMAGDISTGSVEWSGKYLVDPWDQNGLVNLEDWPGLAAYLAPHEDTLRSRHTARSGKWHRTIDRVIDGLMSRPKLYLPDFKERIFPVLDPGRTYPHHNLDWITSDQWDLEVLGGLLLSDIANLFIEAYSVRMRGGYLRFQAQYLRRIRLPELTSVDAESAGSLAGAFRDRDRRRATEVALHLYGIDDLPD